MKANEAPKKIWIDPTNDLPKLSGHIDKDSVEYTKTDVFIDKACEFFAPRIQDNSGGYDRAKVIEDFRNYMKGE